jgi:cyclic pyranopterin phosphate synthase
MPPEGVQRKKHEDILNFTEIYEFAKLAVSMGVTKIRITGGEPLIRKNIIELIKMIAGITGLKDFGMTTNGVYLPEFAQQLAQAGLHRVNISLDTINPEKFKKLTRVGKLEDVMAGIEAAKKAKLLPIKINCVVKKNTHEPDAVEVAKFCQENDLQIRFIREMDLEKGTYWKVKGGTGGSCKICNRLRLTSDGKLRPCLFSEIEYDVRKLGIKNALMQAVGNKPEYGTVNRNKGFNDLGG